MNNNKHSDDENESDEDIVSIARKRFQFAADAENESRLEALDDLKFANGEQWPSEVKKQRDAENRPCLTINRIPQFIRQITNDQRQNRPAIKISPVDDHADIETAKILQGLVRNIEHTSNADTAYDTAFDSAVRAGFGYFRILTEYCDPLSFDQEIKIKRVADRFSVYLDPAYQEPDGSDANWGFVFTDISKEEFIELYPDAELTATHDWESVGDNFRDWVRKDSVRIAEYFYKEFRKAKIVLLNNGETIEKADLPKILPEGIRVVAERESLIPSIKWCKINGMAKLEETDWLGKWIPIIPVLGDDQIIDGKRVLTGIVRNAKDSQRMYNYWKSAETETIALAPKAPWVGYEGQFEGYENEWATANTKNHAYLQVKQVTISGQPAPLPQRNVFEPPVQAITNAGMYAADDLKATTGIYDAAMGAQSNEKSGIAIQRRNMQSQTSNFHFVDNLSKSIRHGGRIVIDLIPHTYDTARAVRILGESGDEEVVRINQMFERKGKEVRYDMGVGKYDVSVDTGPSFETKRQEAVASMADMSRSNPQLMQVAGDIMVKNMDWPGAQEIAERIKKTLPPGMADDDGKKKEIPPEVQAQLQQMGQMVEMLTAKLKEAQEEKSRKLVEIESRERIEFAKLENQATIELAKLESNEALSLLNQQIAELDRRTKLLGFNEPMDFESDDAGYNMAEPPQEFQEQEPQPFTGEFPPGQPTGV